MIHLTSKSLIDHRERARVLSEWELALWWMGALCIGLATLLLCLGMELRGYLMAALYWAIALVRDACGRAVERQVALMRRDICEGDRS